MVNKKFICVLILLLFLTCNCSSAFLFWEDDDSSTELNNIYLNPFETSCLNYSGEFYYYGVDLDINNFTYSDNVDVVITFYADDKLVRSDYDYVYDYEVDEDYNVIPKIEEGRTLVGNKANNVSYSLDWEELSDSDTHNVIEGIYTKNYYNVTKVNIQIIDVVEDKLLFNTTHSFNASEPYLTTPDTNDSSNSNSNEIDSLNDNSGTSKVSITYVASVNSDIFHEPSCSEAKKIKEGNKITFSSRDEALNAGYHPCNFCNP